MFFILAARIEALLQAFFVERAFPFRHHDRCDGVAEEVCRRQSLRHQAVNAEHQRHARHGDAALGAQRRGEYHEGRTGDAGCAQPQRVSEPRWQPSQPPPAPGAAEIALLGGGARHGLATAQHGLHAREQFARVERLAEIVVGAELEPDDTLTARIDLVRRAWDLDILVSARTPEIGATGALVSAMVELLGAVVPSGETV